MSVTVKEVMTHVATCSQCPWKETHYTAMEAEHAGAGHAQQHELFALLGERLDGRIYDYDTHGALGTHFEEACCEARKKGYPYLSFNNSVYPSCAADMERDRLCRAKDVPGLMRGRGKA